MKKNHVLLQALVPMRWCRAGHDGCRVQQDGCRIQSHGKMFSKQAARAPNLRGALVHSWVNEVLRDEVGGTVRAWRCGRPALKYKAARVSSLGAAFFRSGMAKEVLCDKEGPRAAAHGDQSKRHHPAKLGMLQGGVGVGCRGRFHCAQVASGHTRVGARGGGG